MSPDEQIKEILSSPISNVEKIELIEAVKIRAARESFHEFRRFMFPKLKIGWFQKDVAEQLQIFYEDLIAGKRPKLVIEAPPQHGKSDLVVCFIGWLSGKHPCNKTIYTSFSERLGVRANLSLQRMFSSSRYQKIFPKHGIPLKNSVAISAQRLRNREIIEFTNDDGFFRNTTVEGSITGESLDLGVIDDPIRGRKDANSVTKRNSAWDWFTDDFFTRFAEDAGLLCILTRWHIDDPVGRLIKNTDGVRVCKYKAIAEKDEPHRKEGEPLFPELKSIDFLMERKGIMPNSNWMALYQQSPYVQGGEIIKGSMFGTYRTLPPLKWRGIYGDTALKQKEASDYQVAMCGGLGEDGRIYIIDIHRGKYEAYLLEKRFPAFWAKHKDRDTGRLRHFAIEDKASGTELIQRMKNTIRPAIPVVAIQRNKDKYTRVQDVLGYIEAGFIVLPSDAPWVSDFIDECESFTADDAHDHDDQVDPLCDMIEDMLAGVNDGAQVLVF